MIIALHRDDLSYRDRLRLIPGNYRVFKCIYRNTFKAARYAVSYSRSGHMVLPPGTPYKLQTDYSVSTYPIKPE